MLPSLNDRRQAIITSANLRNANRAKQKSHVANSARSWFDSPMQQKSRVLALARDLMFSGKILAEARSLNCEVKIIRDPAQLASESLAARLLVDLSLDGALDAAVEWKKSTGGRIIGFASHVDAATIDRAQQSGFDQVLSRGALSSHLTGLLNAP